MIFFGKNITSVTDPLQRVKVESVAKSIAHPHPDTLSLLRQLRIVRSIDAKQYSALKRRLPFLTCGNFNPPFRRTENFAFIEYFILDIDHICAKGMLVSELRGRLQTDERVLMSFVSPGEDGLKVMFRLSERCYDAGLFSLFYRLFAADFSRQYGMEQVIDTRTCDVTRACFVSYDPEVYYNASATAVSLKSYVDESQPMQFFDLKHTVEQTAKQQSEANPVPNEPRQDVGADVIANIKAILDPKAKKKEEQKLVYVPDQIIEIMDDLQRYITQTGVIVKEIISIQYGKKIRTQVGLRQAETNVFYGKRGFSVVVSPRSGTDPELNTIVADLIQSFFNTH